jgi:hypothetical protein
MHEEGKHILNERDQVFIGEHFDKGHLVNPVKKMDGIIIRAKGRAKNGSVELMILCVKRWSKEENNEIRIPKKRSFSRQPEES